MSEGPKLDELFAAVLAGGPASRKAWDPLYRRCYAYVRSNGLLPADAQDVVSIVMQKLLRTGLPDAQDNAAGYLYTVLYNEAMNWHRKKKPGPLPPGGPEGGKDDEDDPEARADLDCLRKALAAFAIDSEERATVLRLTYLEGRPQKEIAQLIGRSYGATREFLNQTRKKFRTLLLKMCGEVLTVGALEP